MGSQPDFERARQLAPHLFPPDPATLLAKANKRVTELLKIAARYMDRSEQAVLAEIDAIIENPDTAPAVAASSQQTAGEPAFFGHKEKDVYYPIEAKAKSKMKEENIRYFATAEEAEAAGYKTA